MNKIIGHEEILDFFKKVMDNTALSHAYCFVGRKHVGRKTVVDFLASKILEVDQSKLSTCSDYLLVEREINEKTGKFRKDINIEQIKNLVNRLRQRAMKPNGFKIAVIDGADEMNQSAANALLKTLEEPKENTILFLLAEDDKKLLETIKSRCQIIYFTQVKAEKIKSFFCNYFKVAEEKADKITMYSHGLPGLALKWLEKEELFFEYKKEMERFKSFFGLPFYEKIKLVEDLFDKKDDHILARRKLNKVLDIWLDSFHDFLPNCKDSNEFSYRSLVEIEKEILLAKEFINKNIHPRLLIENILLTLP